MDAEEPTSSEASSLAAPARYRLVVRSAAEAVALVRERFGENARVISVRQIEAGGLARFIQKPRLEVVVEVGAPEEPSAACDAAPESAADAAARDVAESGAPLAAETSAAAEDVSRGAPLQPESTPSTSGASSMSVSSAMPVGAHRQFALLRATGIDEMLLARVRADHADVDWNALPAHEALAKLAGWLRRAYAAVPRRPLGSRRVFLGPCGVGKTTALCKALALDVFVHARPVAVLKLDGEQPNATDGLAAFCDVVGAPLLRSVSEVEEFDEKSLLYVDVPGVGLDAHAEQARLAKTLDALRIDTRVLVVNASCEAEVISDVWELGRACGATHVVFTHGDEVRRPGKLWRFVLNGGLRPLFLSAGPSPAGEVEEDVFSALLARTFPRGMARSAGAEGAIGS